MNEKLCKCKKRTAKRRVIQGDPEVTSIFITGTGEYLRGCANPTHPTHHPNPAHQYLTHLTAFGAHLAEYKGPDPTLLESLSNLTHLCMNGCELASIAFVRTLKKLVSASFSSNDIEDTTPLMSLVNVEEVRLSHNPLTGIEFVATLPNLKYLDISYREVYKLPRNADIGNATGTVGGSVTERRIYERTIMLDEYEDDKFFAPMAHISEHLHTLIAPMCGMTEKALAMVVERAKSTLVHLECRNPAIKDVSMLDGMRFDFLNLGRVRNVPKVHTEHLFIGSLEPDSRHSNSNNDQSPHAPHSHAFIEILNTPGVQNLRAYGNITFDAPLSSDTITHLELNNCEFYELPQLDMPSLVKIILSSNNLSDLSCIEQCKALETVQAPYNHLTNKGIKVLETLPNLKSVSLTFNVDLTAIPLFHPLAKVEKLYICECELSTLDPLSLSRLTSLSHLNLEGNRIDDISALSVLGHFSQLKFLDISSNPIKDLSPISSLTSLEFLSARNLVDFDLQVNPDTFIGALSNLRTLDMFYSKIFPFRLKTLCKMKHMSTFRVEACDGDYDSIMWLTTLTSFQIRLPREETQAYRDLMSTAYPQVKKNTKFNQVNACNRHGTLFHLLEFFL